MAAFAEPVVTELTIDARGAEQGAAQYVRAMANAQAAMERQAAVSSKLFEVNNKQAQVTKQMAAANDNVASSWKAVNDNMKSAGNSFLSTAESIITTTGHLKLVALAAYALSPAFRSVANSGFVTVVSSIGLLGPAATSAARTIVSVLSPALSFISRLAIPIGIVVAGWQILNSVINTGAGLLEKYGNAGRVLFGGDVEENLKKLTKLQTDTISLEQVRYATELGSRLNEAKRTIDEFFRVQVDLTDPALKLQNIWVAIVEAIAKALSLLPTIPGAMAAGAQAIGNSSIWNKLGLDWGWNLPGKQRLLGQDQTETVSIEEALRLARGRLAASMGGGFAGRFTQSISDLANPPKKEDDKKNEVQEFDRLLASIERTTAAREADALTVGKSVGEQMRLRTEFRLTEVAQQDIVKHGGNLEDYSERIKKIADRAAEAAQKFAELTAQKKAQFDLDTIFLSDLDKQIAAVQQSLHGDGWRSFMNDGLAATMRLTSAMNEFSNTSREALKGMASEIRTSMQSGATFADAMSNATVNALNRIADKLMQMAIDQLWAKAFGGNGGGFFNIIASLFGGGGGGGGGPPPSFSAKGNVFDQGMMIHPYALGGIASDILVKPTLFPMANGMGLAGEAGPEAIMPLRRGSDGRLGVASQGGGGNFTFAPVYQIDARGSNMSEEQFMAILAKNNKQLAKDIDRSLPDRFAAINRDPRKRG